MDESRAIAVRPSYQIATLNDYAIAQVDPNDLREIIEANSNGEAMTPFDLTQITVGRGGSTMWVIEGTDETVKELNAIILRIRPPRAYWEEPYNTGETSPPDCSSQDGRIGNGIFGPGSEGNPTGLCGTCPMSRWGTATRNGVTRRGQACSQKRLLFSLLPHTVMPVVIRLPSTSLKDTRRYFTNTLLNAQLKFSECITDLTLQAEMKGGYKVAVAKFKIRAELSPEAKVQVELIRKAFLPLFDSMQETFAQEPIDVTNAEE